MTAKAPELRDPRLRHAPTAATMAPRSAAISHVLPGPARGAAGQRSRSGAARSSTPTDVMDVGDGEACVVIDTVVGVEPGTIVAMALDDLARRPGGVAPRSSHALSVDDALLIAEACRGALPAGTFVGIGGKWFGYGERFSRAVTAGLPEFATAIGHSIEELLAPVTV